MVMEIEIGVRVSQQEKNKSLVEEKRKKELRGMEIIRT
jgi:hypothetical protein